MFDAVDKWTEPASNEAKMPSSIYRKICFGLVLLAAQAFLNIGFAVEKTDVLNDAGSAIIWFALAASFAATAILVWEEMLSIKLHVRIIIGVLLELFILHLFYQGSRWSADKAEAASRGRIAQVASQSRIEGMYAKWVYSQIHPIEARSGSTLIVGQPQTAAHPRPDIVMMLIYPKRFSVLIGNRSSVVLDKARLSFAIWDLDNLGSSGYPTILPVPTKQDDWIRPHELIGPEAVISDSDPIVKPNDRLFGWIIASCPECLTTKGYWILARVDQNGWFAEMEPGLYPDIAKYDGNMLLMIRQNPEQYMDGISMRPSVTIYDSLSEIRQF